MKSKFSLLLLLFVFLSFGLIGCSDDDDNNTEILPSEVPNLEIENESVEILLDVENEVSVNIIQGTGEYDVFSLNTNVATARISGNTINIKGLERGNTSVILSDKEARSKVIKVSTLYDKLVFDKEDIVIEYPLGNSSTMEIPITKGNGDYTALADDETIVKAEGTENGIKITTQKKDGKTTILVADATGHEATLNIETKSTLDPYNEYELAAIMGDASSRYIFNGEPGYSDDAEKINTIDKEGMNIYGWNYYNYYYLKIYFPGDKTVGDKPGSKINYSYYWHSITGDLAICRIIKNDGNKIWIVFSYLDNGTVIPGHIVANINPE